MLPTPYWGAPARWVAVNAYWITDDWACRVLGAALGSVNVTRRKLSVPAVRVMFASVRFVPITGALARTLVVVPPHVYV
jgi:hypothetical protein